jgi:hypothetical protein
MPFNKIQIISKSLELLGKGPVTAIDSKITEAAESAFDLLYPADIGASAYSFATKWVQLSKTTGTPILEFWQNEYSLPSDYIKMVEVSPNTDYDIIEDKTLLSNQTELKAKYVFIPEPTLLPAYYVRYLTYSIASHLAEGVIENAAMSERLNKKAALSKQKAQSMNAQSKPNPFKRTSRYISARY